MKHEDTDEKHDIYVTSNVRFCKLLCNNNLFPHWVKLKKSETEDFWCLNLSQLMLIWSVCCS